jgi:hypothetical protein
MTIDIHAHAISTDTVRYPNAPLGGLKSDWSRERPVNVERERRTVLGKSWRARF